MVDAFLGKTLVITDGTGLFITGDGKVDKDGGRKCYTLHK